MTSVAASTAPPKDPNAPSHPMQQEHTRKEEYMGRATAAPGSDPADIVHAPSLAAALETHPVKQRLAPSYPLETMREVEDDDDNDDGPDEIAAAAAAAAAAEDATAQATQTMPSVTRRLDSGLDARNSHHDAPDAQTTTFAEKEELPTTTATLQRQLSSALPTSHPSTSHLPIGQSTAHPSSASLALHTSQYVGSGERGQPPATLTGGTTHRSTASLRSMGTGGSMAFSSTGKARGHGRGHPHISASVQKELRTLEKELDAIPLQGPRHKDLQAALKQRERVFTFVDAEADKAVRIASTDFFTSEHLDLVRLKDQAVQRITSTAYRLHIETETVLPQIERSKMVDQFLLALIHYFRLWLRLDTIRNKLADFRHQVDEVRRLNGEDHIANHEAIQAQETQMTTEIHRLSASLKIYMANLSQKYATLLQSQTKHHSSKHETTYFETVIRTAVLVLTILFENTEYAKQVGRVEEEVNKMYRTSAYQSPRWAPEDSQDKDTLPERHGSAVVNVRNKEHAQSPIVQDYLHRLSKAPAIDPLKFDAIGDSLDQLAILL